MAKMMSKKQMMKELKPTKQQLKKFHDQLKAHGLTKEVLQQGRLDRQSEAWNACQRLPCLAACFKRKKKKKEECALLYSSQVWAQAK